MKIIKRTRGIKEFKLPDAICRSDLTKDFTQIQNSFLRDPNLSSTAKIVLSILLSNKDGWITHKDTLQTMMKEGRDQIGKAMTELTDLGYLKYVNFRDKKSKKVKGGFFAYTDTRHMFDYHKNLEILKKQAMEVMTAKDQRPEFQVSGNSQNTSNDRKSAFFHRKPEKPELGLSPSKNIKILKKEKNIKREDALRHPPIEKEYLKTMKPFIIDDGIKYRLCEDGEYRNKAGDTYIE